MAQTQKYRSRERDRDRERSSGYRRDTSPHKRKRRQEESHESNYHDSHHHHHHHHHKEDKHHNKRSRRSNSTEREETPPWDDEERHYKIRIGEDLTPRYKIMTLMGEGTFGRVVECWDRQTKKSVAVKIVRAIEKYRDAAKLEIEVLDTLKENDPNCTQPLIQMHNWFSFRGHTCMVFPKHGLSLYDFMSKNDFRPFSVSIVQEMGFQLLHSVAYLHSLTLIHTDLKPENILLETSDYEVIDNPPRSYNSVSEFSQRPMRVPLSNRIKLIDFGSATFSHRYHTTVVSTRHYRAPEIMMGMGWSYACDIWSIACIMLQLYTGDTLFQTRENREHLAMMEKVFGIFPEHFVDLADRHTRKYFRHGSVVFPSDDVTTSDERAKQLSYVKHMRRLQDYVAPADDLFLDLLLRLFEYDPAKRISAAEALKHPFFDGVRDMYQYRDSRDKENNRERVRERDRESRDRRDSRESRESRESRDKTRDYRDNRDNREYKDNRDYREYRDYNKDYREYGDRDCVPERRERERDYRDHEREYKDYREREYREGRVYRERDYREYRDDRDRDREHRRYEYRDRYDYRVR